MEVILLLKNNKGMTLVELLVTFSLLMVIVVGMFNLILDFKLDFDNKKIARDFTEYSDFINNDIHLDLIKNKPFAFAIKESNDDAWHCEYSNKYEPYDENSQGSSEPESTSDDDDGDGDDGVEGESDSNCKIEGNTFAPVVSPKEKGKYTQIGDNNYYYVDLGSVCKDVYPCVVYAYPDFKKTSDKKVSVKFTTIALKLDDNADDSNSNDGNKNSDNGIVYNNTFEKIPNQEFLKLGGVSMSIDGGYFTLQFPVYMKNDDKNYGFTIAYLYDELYRFNDDVSEDE